MSDSIDLRAARDLRPGDVIMYKDYPIDLNSVDAFAFGYICLSFGQDEWLSVPPDTAFCVVGRMPC